MTTEQLIKQIGQTEDTELEYKSAKGGFPEKVQPDEIEMTLGIEEVRESGQKLISEKNTVNSEKSSEKNRMIIAAIRQNSLVSAAEIAIQLGISSRAVEKRIKTLREIGIIRRVGPDKGGHWEVITSDEE